MSAVVDGNTTEFAVLTFAREHLRAGALPLLRKALSGITTISCDCKPGEPCHVEVFIDAASDDWLAASGKAFRDAPERNRDSDHVKWPKG